MNELEKKFNLSDTKFLFYRNMVWVRKEHVEEFIKCIATLGLQESQWEKLKELAGEKLI